jgi:phospholipid-translocating ATPase
MMGYVTIFTCLPVFTLIADQDIDVETALTHPPLYKTLQKGRSFSFKMFLVWTLQSVYQVLLIKEL